MSGHVDGLPDGGFLSGRWEPIAPFVVDITVEHCGISDFTLETPCACGSFGVLVGAARIEVGTDERMVSARVCMSCGERR